MRKLKIVMVANHCCVRVPKMAIPLINRGHEVHLITARMRNLDEFYASVLYYTDQDQLYNSIKLHKDADIFHVHNEPSWYVTAIKDVLGDVPVVLDVHDSMLVRFNLETDKPDLTPKDPYKKVVIISADERNNFQLADALVFPSAPMSKHVRDVFDLKQPNLVLYSMLPKGWGKIDSYEFLGGITYEGRVDLPYEIESGKELPCFAYADFTELADQLKEKGIPLFLYMADPSKEKREHYRGKALWGGEHPLDVLLTKLGRHDWGFCGHTREFEIHKYAMCNKLFEYVAAGVPVIAMNAPCMGKFVEKHGLGIQVKSIDELAERWQESRELRKSVVLNRHKWWMENHIERLEKLYRQVL